MLAFYHNFQGWLPESDIASLFDSPPPSRPKLVETRRFIAPPAGLWNLRPNQRVLNPIIPHSIYMYRIFTYMSHKNQPNLGKYTLLVPWESVYGNCFRATPQKKHRKIPTETSSRQVFQASKCFVRLKNDFTVGIFFSANSRLQMGNCKKKRFPEDS